MNARPEPSAMTIPTPYAAQSGLGDDWRHRVQQVEGRGVGSRVRPEHVLRRVLRVNRVLRDWVGGNFIKFPLGTRRQPVHNKDAPIS